MHFNWETFLLIWFVAEGIQMLRKKPLNNRLVVAAIWAFIISLLDSHGAAVVKTPDFMRAPSWADFIVASLVMTVAFYGLRVLLAAGWTKLRTKPVT